MRKVKLYKAQQGGTPDPSTLGYPGAQQQQQPTQEDQLNQIIQSIAADITNKVPKEQTVYKLTSIMGIPVDSVNELYMGIAEQMTADIDEQNKSEYEDLTGTESTKDPTSIDQVITQTPEEEGDTYEYEFDDIESDEILNYDAGPDVLDDALDPLSQELDSASGQYRYGGITQYDDGGEYAIAFPDVSEYMPDMSAIESYDSENYTGYEQAPQEEDQTYDYSNPVDYPNSVIDYSKLQKGGAYKKEKRKYVSSVMNLLKKQMGGEGNQEEDVDVNNGDPIGENLREGKLKQFTNSLKQNVQDAKMKEQLEQEFDTRMQEGGNMGTPDMENPMHHLQLYSDATRGIFSEPMNQTVKARDGLNVPRGFFKRTARRFGNVPNLTSVDVRKTGLFGRPKEYTAYFEPSPLMQISNAAAAAIYADGSQAHAQRKTPAKSAPVKAKEVYTNELIKAVNNESLKEVDKSTPTSEATKVVETPVATTPVSTTPVATIVSPPAEIPPVVIAPDDAVDVSDETVRQFTGVTPGFDYAPGLSNVKENVKNFNQPTGSTLNNILTPEQVFSQKLSAAERTKKAAANPTGGQNLQLPNDSKFYQKYNGKWRVQNNDDTKYFTVTDKTTLNKLNSGQAKGADFYTLEGHGGYQYRVKADGALEKLKVTNGIVSKKPEYVITPNDKSYNYVIKNMRSLEFGGSIENPFNNPNEPLQRFTGGGYDPSEDQIDYSNSIDTTDPYFQRGGMLKNLFPANLSMDQQIVNRIYNPETGEAKQSFAPGADDYIAAIDVRKRNLLGKPKKYTVYYGPKGEQQAVVKGESDPINTVVKDQDQSKPMTKQQALDNAGYGERTDVTGLKANSKRAIKKGEKQRDKDLEKLYEEDPTSVEFTKFDTNTPFDYERVDSITNYLNKEYGDIRGEFDEDAQMELDSYLQTIPSEEDLDTKVNQLISQRNKRLEQKELLATPEQEEINQESLQNNPMFMGYNKSPKSDATNTVVEEEEAPIPNVTSERNLVYDNSFMNLDGPRATEEDQIPTFEEEYMAGNEPTITQAMLDESAGLSLPPEPVNMNALYGDTSRPLLQPGEAPFDYPMQGDREEYYPEIMQPTAPIVQPTSKSSSKIISKATENVKENQIALKKQAEEKRANQIALQNMSTAERTARYDAQYKNQEKIFAYKQYYDVPLQKLNGRLNASFKKLEAMQLSPSEKEKKEIVIYEIYYKELAKLDNAWEKKKESYKQYGGSLNKFVYGGEDDPFTGTSPIAYNNNPIMTDKKETPGIPAFATPGASLQSMLGLEPIQKPKSSLTAIEVEDPFTTEEREATLNTGNAAARGITGIKNRITDAQQMKGFYDNYTSDNLYASDPNVDRGDYAESGLYRPNEQGQTWNSRSKQYGGDINEDPDYVEGDEIYMTDDEIRQYMAQGGQIEFI